MAVCLAAVLFLAFLLQDRLISAFRHNPGLNLGILAVLVIGIVFIFFQVFRLYPEVRWIDHFRHGDPDVTGERPPRLLAALAAMIGSQRGRLNLSAATLRSLLDGISGRLNESHEISRYLIALLVFLGLLGTFWGLLGTINAVGDAVSNLAIGSGDPAAMFAQLKEGLRAPLVGMGTAFGASLFGLAGSLILGFLELQASQAHGRFFNELEDWLAGQTRLSTLGPTMDVGDDADAALQALARQTALTAQAVASLAEAQQQMLPALNKLAGTGAPAPAPAATTTDRTRARPAAPALPAPALAAPALAAPAGADGMAQANQYLKALAEGFVAVGRQAGTMQTLLTRIAEGQTEQRAALAKLGEGGRAAGVDETLRGSLRNVEGLLHRLSDQSSSAQGQAMMLQTTQALDRLQATLAENERAQARTQSTLKSVADGIARMSQRMDGEQSLVAALVQAQNDLKPLLAALAAGSGAGGGAGFDEQSRHHLRNIDAYLSRLLEEISLGRQHTVQELRNEIRTLAKSLPARDRTKA
jgi:hypothetical protein